MDKKSVKFKLSTKTCINCKYFKEGTRDTCALLNDKDNVIVPYSTCKEFIKHD